MQAQATAPVPQGKLISDGTTLIVPSNRAASVWQGMGTLAGALGFDFFCWRNHANGDWMEMIFAHVAGLLAMVMLLCAIQSTVWAWRNLPDVIVHEHGLTTFLTGFHAIHLAEADVAGLLLHLNPRGGPSLVIEPCDRETFRRGMGVLDRYYFDQSRRFAGHGLSYSLHLNAEELSHLYARLREQYGDRAKSHIHVEG